MMASNCIYCFNVRQFGHVLCLLLSVADFIRHPAQMSHQWDMIQQLPQQSLIPMFDGVNVVSNCAWTVNKPVSSSARVIMTCNYHEFVVLLHGWLGLCLTRATVADLFYINRILIFV